MYRSKSPPAIIAHQRTISCGKTIGELFRAIQADNAKARARRMRPRSPKRARDGASSLWLSSPATKTPQANESRFAGKCAWIFGARITGTPSYNDQRMRVGTTAKMKKISQRH